MNNARQRLPLARAHVEQIFPKLTPAQNRRIAARLHFKLLILLQSFDKNLQI